MKLAIKTTVIIFSVLASAALGYYLGLRRGMDTMAVLASQNEVSEALSNINSSLLALRKSDLSYSLEQHNRDLDSSLIHLGTYSGSVPYWKCGDREKKIILDARDYLSSHPITDHSLPQAIINKALRFCQ